MAVMKPAPVTVISEVEPTVAATSAELIDQKRRELERASIESAEEHDRAAEITAAARAETERLKRAIGVASLALGTINSRLTEIENDGMTHALASIDRGSLDVSKIASADGLMVEYRAVKRFLEAVAEERLPDAEIRFQECEISEILAQVARIERLADKRQFETELRLAEIAIEEGDAVLLESRTRTGLLREEAARLRIEAGRLQ